MTTDISMVRWDPSVPGQQDILEEYEYDGGNSSSRLFERSRIKALAGKAINILSKIQWFASSVAPSTKEHISMPSLQIEPIIFQIT